MPDSFGHGSGMDVDDVAARLGALGNRTRLEIYRILVRAGDPGLAVGEIQRRTGVPNSTLSHHLRQLMAVGLVTQERQGTTLICRNDGAAMNATLGFLIDQCCADAVEADAA